MLILYICYSRTAFWAIMGDSLQRKNQKQDRREVFLYYIIKFYSLLKNILHQKNIILNNYLLYC